MDLAQEGDALRISRQHAKLELKRDGNFYLRNIARRPVLVNDVKVQQVLLTCLSCLPMHMRMEGTRRGSVAPDEAA